jgi:hypothetical protein
MSRNSLQEHFAHEPGAARMIPDFETYRSANNLVKRHGEDAPIHAAKRAAAMLEAGDLDGYAMWERILRAVEELQGTEPKPGEAIH